MTPAAIASLRALVPVRSDQPGSMTSHLLRLERAWRAANDTPAPTVRSCSFDPAELDGDNLSACERCDQHWSRCACGSGGRA